MPPARQEVRAHGGSGAPPTCARSDRRRLTPVVGFLRIGFARRAGARAVRPEQQERHAGPVAGRAARSSGRTPPRRDLVAELPAKLQNPRIQTHQQQSPGPLLFACRAGGSRSGKRSSAGSTSDSRERSLSPVTRLASALDRRRHVSRHRFRAPWPGRSSTRWRCPSPVTSSPHSAGPAGRCPPRTAPSGR